MKQYENAYKSVDTFLQCLIGVINQHSNLTPITLKFKCNNAF